jgi:integrase
VSVYKPPQSRLWQYDFVLKGRRFHGSTGQKTRRAAERFEGKLREDAALGRLEDAAQMSIDAAAQRWWEEVGQHRQDHEDVDRRLGYVVELIGKARKLVEIDTPAVSRAIQKRRKQTFTKSKKRGAKAYPISNATVNRDIIEHLRPILRRAEIHWGAQGLPKIDWKELRLGEPYETVQVYSRSEQAAWLAQCDPPSRQALTLLLTYALRLSELFFPPSAFEPDGPRLVWMKGRRWKVPHSVPLMADHAGWIAQRVAQARRADLKTIWYDETDGVLSPLTYYGLQARLNAAARRAGITAGRKIHGARHHAGTTIMRHTGNPKITQKLLGHISAASTQRYIHAVEDDVRGALEGLTATEKARAKPARKYRYKAR